MVGCETDPFPSFQRRGGCAINKRSRSLAAQTGWFVISNDNKVRFADIYKEATRHFTGLLLMLRPIRLALRRPPSAPNALMPRHPPFKEGNGASTGAKLISVYWNLRCS